MILMIIRIIRIGIIVLVLSGCAKTEILGMPEAHEQLDTLATKAHRPPPKPPRDTTERQDTARVPIGWDPSVEDWDETEIEG